MLKKLPVAVFSAPALFPQKGESLQVRQRKKASHTTCFFSIQSEGLVCNQCAYALYVIATKSRMESRASVYVDPVHQKGGGDNGNSGILGAADLYFTKQGFSALHNILRQVDGPLFKTCGPKPRLYHKTSLPSPQRFIPHRERGKRGKL